jgi:hypothetical protein
MQPGAWAAVCEFTAAPLRAALVIPATGLTPRLAPTPFEVEEQLLPGLCTFAYAVDQADETQLAR